MRGRLQSVVHQVTHRVWGIGIWGIGIWMTAAPAAMADQTPWPGDDLAPPPAQSGNPPFPEKEWPGNKWDTENNLDAFFDRFEGSWGGCGDATEYNGYGRQVVRYGMQLWVSPVADRHWEIASEVRTQYGQFYPEMSYYRWDDRALFLRVNSSPYMRIAYHSDSAERLSYSIFSRDGWGNQIRRDVSLEHELPYEGAVVLGSDGKPTEPGKTPGKDPGKAPDLHPKFPPKKPGAWSSEATYPRLEDVTYTNTRPLVRGSALIYVNGAPVREEYFTLSGRSSYACREHAHHPRGSQVDDMDKFPWKNGRR